MRRSVLLTALLLVSCGSDSQTVATTVATTRAPTSSLSGEFVFEDDFSDPSSGWETGDDGTAVTAYDNGGLRVTVNTPDSTVVRRPPPPRGQRKGSPNIRDVSVEVAAKRNTGTKEDAYGTSLVPPDPGMFGLTCRGVASGDRYFLGISREGTYDIAKSKAGRMVSLLAQPGRSDMIKKENGAVNEVQAECVGGVGREPTTLRLHVNGTKVAEVADEDDILNEAEGAVGVEVRTAASALANVWIDVFRVRGA